MKTTMTAGRLERIRQDQASRFIEHRHRKDLEARRELDRVKEEWRNAHLAKHFNVMFPSEHVKVEFVSTASKPSEWKRLDDDIRPVDRRFAQVVIGTMIALVGALVLAVILG